MAVSTRYYSVIIPIQKIINLKGEDWWKNYLKENERLIGDILWYDDLLLRDGAMGEEDLELIIKFWEAQGLDVKIKKENKIYWNDLCIVDAIEGPTLPCDWLEFVKDKKVGSYAYLKDKPIGKIIGKGNREV